MKFRRKKENSHLAEKDKKQFTIMLIPHGKGKPKSLGISLKTMFLTGMGLVMTLGFLTFFSTYYFQEYRSTHDALDIAKEVREEVIVENQRQREEIEALEGYAMDVEKEVSDLADLQKEIIELVGLDSEAYATLETKTAPVTRSRNLNIDGSNPLDRQIVQQGGEDLLAPLIEQRKTEMTSLIPEVEDQIEYLDAKPNVLPAEGRITSPFGERRDPFNRTLRQHNGVDIANDFNTPIHAAGTGVVTFSGYQGSYGRVIVISHGNGYESLYAHNQKNLVSEGDRVEKHEEIAKMGSSGRSTGPHVHFEVRENGTPIDPKSILRDENEN
ncbi:M23 family metallopeptidase [Isachenkonia alkalipeptolytica]|nr:M23 family metallopeptidase [Isachenkonia alkalipeptolytica]